MYFPRHIDTHLQSWKESPRLKPLLLRGARQVGKSASIRHLGESFEHFVEVNFETRPALRQLFLETGDVREICARLSVLMNTPISEGRTLLFLDEIQACPEAIRSLWAFKEDMPGLHVAAAGSLLEFALKDLSSFGVGRIRSMFMYPLSFDEFLSASGLDGWVKAKNEAGYDNPLPPELHQALVGQFRSFLMVGGMPACVETWTRTRDYLQCAEEQEDIQQTYYDDFAKYSGKIDPMLLRNTLRSVIMQTGGKFVYSRVEGGFRADEVKRALSMLCDAGLVKPVQYSAGNGLPLGAETNDKFRKYNYLDTGLMLRILDLELGSSQPLTELILTGAAEDLVNKGKISEMAAGWEIIKSMSPRTSHDLYYWENISDGCSAEVDYLLQQDLSVLPLEIKAGTTGKMKSLRSFIRSKHLTLGMRSSLEKFGKISFVDAEDSLHPEEQKTIFIHPLYALGSLRSQNL